MEGPPMKKVKFQQTFDEEIADLGGGRRTVTFDPLNHYEVVEKRTLWHRFLTMIGLKRWCN